ncbi:hypothetical protein XpiCFBP4643_19230 [Xanthomonas pisi]|uniref:Uncharacterized protein n=1 Tax=Xanthomonas pisi TaxID=56457 RepID=A0A2S7CY54_9XANT|nr:hypothetical protein XpiCFBP4643_19230 [Xanthomonas pisi]
MPGKDVRAMRSAPATNEDVAATKIGRWATYGCSGLGNAGIAQPRWTGLFASGSSACATVDDNPPAGSFANRFHRLHA